MESTSLFEREALTHMSSLRSFASSLCKDPQRVDDLVQETLLKAFKYFHTYSEGTNCRAWLFQICKNLYFNERRRRQFEPVLVDFQDEGGTDHSDRDVSEERELHPQPVDNRTGLMHERLFGDEVTVALASIPGEYQTALILSDVEGYSYEEIATFLGAPLGTVRSRIHRGRKLMARKLGDYARREGYREFGIERRAAA